MKAGPLVVGMALLLAVGAASAQQRGIETSDQGASPFPENRFSSLLTQNSATARSDLRVGKRFCLQGPLVRAFRGGKIAGLPRRALHFVNPFSPVERVEILEKTRDINPRAWSTMVGLHPGGSVFVDGTTHESSLGLLTVGR